MGRIGKVSIIVSVYNEEASLPAFFAEYEKLRDRLSCGHEIIFVNDGSRDGSEELLKAYADGKEAVKLICFSRNFGHEAAMIAGIDNAEGDLVICLDADLQHPPALIPDMIAAAEEGYDVICMLRDNDAGMVRHLSTRLYYWFMSSFSSDGFESGASDFFAVTKPAADVLRRDYRERNRFLRGYVQNIGFKKKNISYHAADRTAGSSKYPFIRLFRLSEDSITCFMDIPLKLGYPLGICTGIAALVLLIRVIVMLARGTQVTEAAVILIVMLALFTLLFELLGVFGSYIAMLRTEIKGRPLYIVRDRINFE